MMLNSKSVQVDKTAIQSFVRNENAPFLVSFPRTGSHWLRMMMELYFERPSLVRVFFYPERIDYLTYHTHDIDLMVVDRKNVIYLYREPVATIYSQLRYHEQSYTDRNQIEKWSELYGRHLDKWLHQEQFTTHKTVLRYEKLRSDIHREFSKLCDHFGETIDEDKLSQIVQQVDKQRVQERTTHDRQVINTTEKYSTERDIFEHRSGNLVWEIVLDGRPYLAQYFD